MAPSPVLDAGHATIEVLSAEQSDHVEEIEAGGRRPDVVRLALEGSGGRRGRRLVSRSCRPGSFERLGRSTSR
jgi:hypothetical protein